MKPAPRFERVTLDGPPRGRAWRIFCSHCPAFADLADGRLPSSRKERDGRFRGQGWAIGRARHVCPACQEPAAPAATATTRPKGEDMAHATPPREPTLADNRRVHEAIEDHWNAERGVYAGAASDQQVADKLDVPLAWVARIRAGFFGPRDECEARKDGLAALGELEGRAGDLEARAMQLAVEAEALKREVAAARRAAGV